MRNTNACARYNFDIFTNTLTISKEFEKRAAIPGSAEQRTFCDLLATYGDSLVVEHYKTHQCAKGPNFKAMEVFISKCRDAEKRLGVFDTVKELSKGQQSRYKYVKTWFFANYPNYSETPEFDEEGFIILKSEAQMKDEQKAKEAVTMDVATPVEAASSEPTLELLESA